MSEINRSMRIAMREVSIKRRLSKLLKDVENLSAALTESRISGVIACGDRDVVGVLECVRQNVSSQITVLQSPADTE